MSPSRSVYQFWPVGQGLFATGSLETEASRKAVHWVYDCGTVSAPNFVNDAVADYRASFGGAKPRIDLVVISHFDKDHLSGMANLLSKATVGTLLLPYMPLWQRLWCAFVSGVATDSALFRFFVNPAAYMAAIGDSEIEEILFVSPSGGFGPGSGVGQQGEDEPIDQENNGSRFQGERRTARTSDEIEAARIDADVVGAPNIRFLASKRLVVHGWEFIPYNEAKVLQRRMPKKMLDFRRQVAALADQFLAAPTDDVLKKLKHWYDTQFGSGSVNRNLISLFLYVGPFGPNGSVVQFAKGGDKSSWCWIHRQTPENRAAVLYTGDGFLNTVARYEAMKKFVGAARIEKVACLQVMHHGARGNWYKGLAAEIAPIFSVFCSDPLNGAYDHPHSQVVLDFLKHQPIQVDKFGRFQLEVIRHP